ncbi:TolC family protein, partial [Desulfovibrio sp. XJ01]|nr:TolC family protein [Nitratidesulfovibrio liaohensis]
MHRLHAACLPTTQRRRCRLARTILLVLMLGAALPASVLAADAATPGAGMPGGMSVAA